MATRTLLPCTLALAALVAALATTVTGGGTLADRGPLHGWYALDAGLFVLALLLLRRVPARRVAPLVLAGSVAVAAVGLLAPPRTSDDAYRYVWDGRVQAAGISPYAHAPDDPALARLRDPGLFPVTDGCRGWDERRTAAGDCTRINRPAVRTIYPPVAQAWFLAVHPFGGGVRGVQVGGALLAVATTGALLVVGRGGRRAALWGWCPGITVWAVNDAHVDTLAARTSRRAPPPPDSTPPDQRPGPFWYAYEPTPMLWWRRIRGNLTPRSVYFRNALRTAGALGAARLVVGALDLTHGFWVLLATLTLMRTSAADTRITLRPALAGTAGGAAVTALLLIAVGEHPVFYAAALPPAMLVAFGFRPGVGL
ncbi:FUSC family protein, partial [Kitasatospora sp. NPDC058263]